MWTTGKIIICVGSIALVGGLKFRDHYLNKKLAIDENIDLKIAKVEEDKKNAYIGS